MSLLTREAVKPGIAAGDTTGGAIPRVTIQAFCDTTQTAQLLESSIHDRRMAKVALTTHTGGIAGAVATYKHNSTPNLIVVETALGLEALLPALERLVQSCDATARIVVLGHVNDVRLYREVLRAGLADYIVLPTTAAQIVSSIGELFATKETVVGRTIGFVSAKGGAGGSTLAHNIAWSTATLLNQDSVVLDMDLAFGTAGLNFNQDPAHGIAQAMTIQPGDQPALDRLMSKIANHVNLLTAPASLERSFDPAERAFEALLTMCRSSTPIVVLDIPHAWNAWVRHTLATIDEVVIVAEPDLANLRNAKNLVDALKILRLDASAPFLVLNKVGVPRRPEIAPAEFAQSVGCSLLGHIPFDAALFGMAANNGQMIAESAPNHKINEIFRAIGLTITGHDATQVADRASPLLKLPSFLRKRA